MKLSNVALTLFTAGGIWLAIWAGGKTADSISSSQKAYAESRSSECFEHGRKAAKAGIEADANPYVHWDRRVQWLDGYIDQKASGDE